MPTETVANGPDAMSRKKGVIITDPGLVARRGHHVELQAILPAMTRAFETTHDETSEERHGALMLKADAGSPCSNMNRS